MQSPLPRHVSCFGSAVNLVAEVEIFALCRVLVVVLKNRRGHAVGTFFASLVGFVPEQGSCCG